MTRAFWIAADLIKDAAASGSFLGLVVFLGLWLPFQAGLIDGLNARAGQVPALRHSIVMNASWPALAILGVHAQVFFPRRFRRELEPLLAAPVTDLEIVVGLSLPVLIVMAGSPPVTFVLNRLGLRLAADALPDEMSGQFCQLWLATQVACLWLTAFGLDASFKARTQGAYVIRATIGYLVLAGVDAVLFTLRLTGHARLEAPVMAAALASGAGALCLVSLRLDREDLIERI